MGITFAILSFDGKTPVSIDLLIAMLSGDDMVKYFVDILFFTRISDIKVPPFYPPPPMAYSGWSLNQT